MLRDYFYLLVEATRITKKIKRAKKKVTEKFEEDTRKNFFRYLCFVLAKKRRRNNLVNGSLRKKNLRTMKFLFNFWREDVWRMKTFNKVLSKYEQEFNIWKKLLALHKLKINNVKEKVFFSSKKLFILSRH